MLNISAFDPGYLQQQAKAKFDEAERLNEAAAKENREFSATETARFESLLAEGSDLAEQAQHRHDCQLRGERLAGEAGRNGLPTTNPIGGSIDDLYGRKTMQPNVIAPKLSAFTGQDAQKNAYESGLWLKNFITGNYNAAQTEGTPGAGGYAVPVELARAVINVREENGVSRKLAKVYPMTTDTLDVPRLLTGTTTTYPGEASAITASDPTWGQVSFNAKKRATLVKVSNELLEDNVVMLADFVAQTIGKDQASTEDGEYILGDGTSTYGGETGLLASLGSAGVFTAASGVDTWGELTMPDFTSTMAKLPSKYTGPLSWLCSREFYYSVMLRLLAGAGGNNMMVLEGGASVPSFLGSPVYFSSKMPTASAASTVAALFGSFSEASAIGDRRIVQVQTSQDRFFDEDCTGIRGISRYSINCFDLGNGSTAGGVVGLKTNS